MDKINILKKNKTEESYCISKKPSFLKELAIFKVKKAHTISIDF